MQASLAVFFYLTLLILEHIKVKKNRNFINKIRYLFESNYCVIYRRRKIKTGEKRLSKVFFLKQFIQ